MKSPIFIFSLPRAGSTLLQRVLMSHSEIASVAEPWILLHFLYAHKNNGVLSEYSHQGTKKAIDDFINNLPNDRKDYNEELSSFIFKLYDKQCINGETYFLDKTPRYHLIIDEIVELFPNAKFIFLFRNPIHIMSSIMETWCNGGFYGMFRYNIDLTKGIANLAKGYNQLGERSLAISYEDLVIYPEKTVKDLCEYLELPFETEMLKNFSRQDIKGNMGDPTGMKLYNTIETKSLEKWRIFFNNRYRIFIAKKYVYSLKKEDLSIHGFDQERLIQELNQVNTKKIMKLKDWIHIILGRLILKYNLNILFGSKTSKLAKKRYLS